MNRTDKPNGRPVHVPGGNTDPANDPQTVPIYIGAILAYADAETLARELGATHPMVQSHAQLAHRQLIDAAATIMRAREAAR
jgi:hypothetical protein